MTTPMSWSMNPSNIRLRLTDPSHSTSVITIRNCLNRRSLTFNLHYRADYLTVEPSQGQIEPLATIDLLVRPSDSCPLLRHDTTLTATPWTGTITIWCNKFNRDVQVVMESPPPPVERRLTAASKPFDASTPHSRLCVTSNDFEQDSLEPGSIAAHDLVDAPSGVSALDSLLLTPLISASLTPRFINSIHSSNMSSLASVSTVATPSLTAVSKLQPNESTNNLVIY